VFLQETHLDNENAQDLYIPEFSKGIHYTRNKRKNAVSSSGGLSIFIRENIRNLIKVLPQNNCDTVKLFL
jgi:hypothetical protein